jgi:predicted DNA-binding transcriptional regulator YafY
MVELGTGASVPSEALSAIGRSIGIRFRKWLESMQNSVQGYSDHCRPLSLSIRGFRMVSAGREIISQVSEATGKRKRVQISYKAASTGKDTTRKIDPYQVWAMNGGF